MNNGKTSDYSEMFEDAVDVEVDSDFQKASVSVCGDTKLMFDRKNLGLFIKDLQQAAWEMDYGMATVFILTSGTDKRHLGKKDKNGEVASNPALCGRKPPEDGWSVRPVNGRIHNSSDICATCAKLNK